MSLPNGWEWVLIIILAFVLFGPKKLPELARSIGEGIREFKKSLSGAARDDAPPDPKPPSPETTGSTRTPDRTE